MSALRRVRWIGTSVRWPRPTSDPERSRGNRPRDRHRRPSVASMGLREQGPETVRTRRLARWTNDLADPRQAENLAVHGFSFVAGAGFEPATFGL